MDLEKRYEDFFNKAMGWDRHDPPRGPYPYQIRLATDPTFPDLLDIPTGLGKTAAVILAWLWRRRFDDDRFKNETPRRLVYCLPMRVLVEQTASNVRTWLENLGIAGTPGGGKVSVHAPGGTTEAVWREADDEMLITGRADLIFCGEWFEDIATEGTAEHRDL